MRRLLPLAVGTGLLLLLHTACSQPVLTEYKSPEGAVLKVPADWQQVTGLVNIGDLQLSDAPHKRHFVAVSEKRDTLRNNTIERYSKFTREGIRDGLNFAKMLGPRHFEISGMKAVQYEISGTVGNEEFLYLHTIVEGKEYLHQLIGWTPASLKETNWPVLHRITNDFREK